MLGFVVLMLFLTQAHNELLNTGEETQVLKGEFKQEALLQMLLVSIMTIIAFFKIATLAKDSNITMTAIRSVSGLVKSAPGIRNTAWAKGESSFQKLRQAVGGLREDAKTITSGGRAEFKSVRAYRDDVSKGREQRVKTSEQRRIVTQGTDEEALRLARRSDVSEPLIEELYMRYRNNPELAARVLGSQNASQRLLREGARSRNQNLQLAAAQHKNISERDLRWLAANTTGRVQAAARSNLSARRLTGESPNLAVEDKRILSSDPSTEQGTLRSLAGDGDRETRINVLNNPSVTDAILTERSEEEGDARVIEVIIGHTLTGPASQRDNTILTNIVNNNGNNERVLRIVFERIRRLGAGEPNRARLLDTIQRTTHNDQLRRDVSGTPR